MLKKFNLIYCEGKLLCNWQFWSARLAPLILRDKHKAVKFRISLECSKMEEMNGDLLVILRGKEGYCQKATVNQTCTVGNPSCLEEFDI